MDVDRASVAHRSCKKDGEQSSWLNVMVGDCLCLWKAVATNEINLSTEGKKEVGQSSKVNAGFVDCSKYVAGSRNQ